ncbi:MAG: hypothetical protein M0R80_03150 [Proteobacteria bacterium]|nr:hypothetical protein [Pseudomonadota bacterium]
MSGENRASFEKAHNMFWQGFQIDSHPQGPCKGPVGPLGALGVAGIPAMQSCGCGKGGAGCSSSSTSTTSSSKAVDPPKWTDVYPQGSKAGNEEQKLFIALARNPKWKFRSVTHLSKEANLTKERVEQILQKYYKKGMVFPNPKQEDQWAYWERCPELLPGNIKSIAEADQDKRCEDAA